MYLAFKVAKTIRCGMAPLSTAWALGRQIRSKLRQLKPTRRLRAGLLIDRHHVLAHCICRLFFYALAILAPM